MLQHDIRSSRRVQWVDGFAILAIVIGLSGVLGRMSGFSLLSQVEWGSAIAPNPSPYTRIDKIRPEAVSFMGLQFACEEPNGQLNWIPWDYHYRALVPGPHRRTIGILNFFGLAQRYPLSPALKKHFKAMNDYYFCNNGPLAQAMKCGPSITGVRFKWLDSRGNRAWPREVRQTCSR